MRRHFAPSMALLLGIGAWAGHLGAVPVAEPTPLQDPYALAYDPLHGIVEVWCAEDQVRRFDAFLQELPSIAAAGLPPAHAVTEVVDGILYLDVWSRRRLEVEVASGTMWLSGSPWEDPPLLTWGPGWALVEWRTADPESRLQWRRGEGEEPAEAAAVCDRWDGLRRRAWLEGLVPGELIELRYRPSGTYYPPRTWGAWREFTVPEVDPAGARPTEGLPRG